MIETKDLPNLIIPSDGIRMVIMQPHISGNLSQMEPFKWLDEKKDAQLEKIRRTLEIAKSTEFDIDSSHFTIFPEYTIPGLEGVNAIQSYLNNTTWQDNTVVIGGVDGLSREEYAELVSASIVATANDASAVGNTEWVNCCVTWIKARGSVIRYVQPKLQRAREEMTTSHENMFKGKSVFLFQARFSHGVNFNFFSLICIDWISRPNTATEGGVLDVLKAMNDVFHENGNAFPLHVAFIIKHNDSPNDQYFLQYTNRFFSLNNSVFPKIDTKPCLVVFANSACGKRPQLNSTHGFTSVIAHPNAGYSNEKRQFCPKSYAIFTDKLRRTDTLHRYNDCLFRESGACIHTLILKHPVSVGTNANQRCLPIDEAAVHKIEEDICDPRCPEDGVPAIVKWTNDHIDSQIFPISGNNEIGSILSQCHATVCEQLRWESSKHLMDNINIATNRHGYNDEDIRKEIVDTWEVEEIDSLSTIINTLTALFCKAKYEVKVAGITSRHAVITTNTDDVIDIYIVVGSRYYIRHEENLKHFAGHCESNRAARKIVLISRADRDYSLSPRDKNVSDIASKDLVMVDYRDIMDCLRSNNSTELSSKISNLIGVENV